jgi:hypothetical protein
LPVPVGPIGLILALTGFSLFRYFTQPLKDDWRSATQVLYAHRDEKEPVVFDTDYETTTLKYHTPRFGRTPEKMIELISGPSKEGNLSSTDAVFSGVKSQISREKRNVVLDFLEG